MKTAKKAKNTTYRCQSNPRVGAAVCEAALRLNTLDSLMQCLLRLYVRSLHLSLYGTVLQNQYPIAHGQKLGEFRGDHNYSFARISQPTDDVEDLRFSPYVDAGRRPIHDENLWFGRQPFCYHHLLLVTT